MTTAVVVGDYRRANGGRQRYRPTEIACPDGFGDDELDALCEGRWLVEDEGKEKVHWTSGTQDLGRTFPRIRWHRT